MGDIGREMGTSRQAIYNLLKRTGQQGKALAPIVRHSKDAPNSRNDPSSAPPEEPNQRKHRNDRVAQQPPQLGPPVSRQARNHDARHCHQCCVQDAGERQRECAVEPLILSLEPLCWKPLC
jgi:hypothetical protein